MVHAERWMNTQEMENKATCLEDVYTDMLRFGCLRVCSLFCHTLIATVEWEIHKCFVFHILLQSANLSPKFEFCMMWELCADIQTLWPIPKRARRTLGYCEGDRLFMLKDYLIERQVSEESFPVRHYSFMIGLCFSWKLRKHGSHFDHLQIA